MMSNYKGLETLKVVLTLRFFVPVFDLLLRITLN